MHISEGSTVVIPVMKNLEMDPKLIGRTNVMDQNFTEMQEMSPTLSTILSLISQSGFPRILRGLSELY